MGWQPFVNDQTGQSAKGLPVTEEPGLGHKHRLDQLIPFSATGLEQVLVVVGLLKSQTLHARAYRPLDQRRADGRGIQANGVAQEMFNLRHGSGWQFERTAGYEPRRAADVARAPIGWPRGRP